MSFNCLLVTHNNIIQCFIEKLRPAAIINGEPQKIRFKNCAILCLSLDLENNQFRIELIFDGLLSNEETKNISPDRPYYVTSVIKSGDVLFEPIIGDISLLNILPEDLANLRNKTEKNMIKFYIVRHGQAEHNVSRLRLNMYDTSITNIGRDQAITSAKALKKILDRNDETINIVFASDLARTRQTALPFFNIMFLEPRIIIDPCSNELSTNGDGTGNCYEKNAKKLVKALENFPNCTPETCRSIKTMSGARIAIDWSLYRAFYSSKKNNVRSYSEDPDEHPNCKDTNMIAMAVFYLLNIDMAPNVSQIETIQSGLEEEGISIGGGSRRRKRYTKRHNKKRNNKSKHRYNYN
jgi:broad specificity phosphatase PhoE